MAESKKPRTMAVHSGRMTREHFGTVNTPVYRTSTILAPDLATLEAHNAPYVYGRRGTPTSRASSRRSTRSKAAKRRWSCRPDWRAITLALLSVCSAGDHVLMTDSCLSSDAIVLRPDAGSASASRRATTTRSSAVVLPGSFEPNTKAVFCEAPGSLTFEMQDIAAIAEAAHARKVRPS